MSASNQQAFLSSKLGKTIRSIVGMEASRGFSRALHEGSHEDALFAAKAIQDPNDPVLCTSAVPPSYDPSPRSYTPLELLLSPYVYKRNVFDVLMEKGARSTDVAQLRALELVASVERMSAARAQPDLFRPEVTVVMNEMRNEMIHVLRSMTAAGANWDVPLGLGSQADYIRKVLDFDPRPEPVASNASPRPRAFRR